ncbi:hypothetical protein BGX23_002478, partial [Mortierella sp. AD031]
MASNLQLPERDQDLFNGSCMAFKLGYWPHLRSLNIDGDYLALSDDDIAIIINSMAMADTLAFKRCGQFANKSFLAL